MDQLAPKAGDDCLSCADHWDNREMPRKKLVLIGTTQNQKVQVPICPYCDGERALKLATRKS